MFDSSKFLKLVEVDFGKLSLNQKSGFKAVLAACQGAPIADASYMLATAYHETQATMQPVREAFYLSENWRKTHLRYYPHYGRGYVQLTWEDGYKKADRLLNLKGTLVKNLDRAMEPEIAAKIMRRGMDEGWFTGQMLKNHLPRTELADRKEFITARQIINGVDKALAIAGYAMSFQTDLKASGW